MAVLEKAFEMLSKYPLCDHCLGRQFAKLGYSMENNTRGQALKISLLLQANELFKQNLSEGLNQLQMLAKNGFSREAEQTLNNIKKLVEKDENTICFLCENKFRNVEALTEKMLQAVIGYEFKTFLVGIEMPARIEEQEDEFKATFNIGYGENIWQSYC